MVSFAWPASNVDALAVNSDDAPGEIFSVRNAFTCAALGLSGFIAFSVLVLIFAFCREFPGFSVVGLDGKQFGVSILDCAGELIAHVPRFNSVDIRHRTIERGVDLIAEESEPFAVGLDALLNAVLGEREKRCTVHNPDDRRTV